MGLFSKASNKAQQVRQEWKDTKILAPDGTWVHGRKEYKAAAARAAAKKGGK